MHHVARFGLWFAGLPEPWLWLAAVIWGYGVIFYGFCLAQGLHAGKIKPPSTRNRWAALIAYLIGVTLFMTLMTTSALITQFDSKYDAVLQALPPQRREILMSFMFSWPLWCGYLFVIIRELVRCQRSAM